MHTQPGMTPPVAVLVTGATGYIGGRLTPRLIDEGHRVGVLVRNAARVRSRSWAERVEIVEGDALDREALSRALAGVDCAYYLIHSMGSGAGFHELDVEAARLFGQVAGEAGVRRIVYLGGLGDPKADLSRHLRSRQETGRALREGGVPVTEFRAAVIVGSGSISFEMIRYLVERLPVMVCPRWVYSRVQPIAVNDVLDYLAAALTNAACGDKVIEIGGQGVTTYKGMMLDYARARGLKRWLVPVPVLTPRLSSYWVHWITPIPSRVSGPLIDGLRNEVVVTDNLALDLFPGIEPRDYAEAIAEVIEDLDHGPHRDRLERRPRRVRHAAESLSRVESHEGMIFERRTRQVAAPARAGVPGVHRHRRRPGMVLRRLDVAGPGHGRPPAGGRGAAPGTPASRRVARRRRAGFLAGGGPGAGPAGPAQGGDEAAGPRLAPVPRVGDQGGDHPAGADRRFPSQGPGRAALLVRPVPGSRQDLRRAGAGDRKARRGEPGTITAIRG